VGERGPAPKPTRLRVLEGNPGRRPLPKNEPQPAAGAPSCPSILSPEARAQWRKLVKAMPDGLLTKADQIILATLCEAWADWCEAVEDLRVNGWYYTTEKGFEGQRPAAAKMKQATATIISLSSRLGLSPADRTRLSMPEAAPKTLEELLG
jgi:P27 family predicted phage terminase small subunit